MNDHMKRTVRTSLRTAAYLAALVFLLFMIFPFIWMILTSVKDNTDIFAWPPQLIPGSVHFENYGTALTIVPFGRFYLNSFIVTASITFGTLFLDSLAGYVFAKFDFSGRPYLFFLLLASYMVPIQSIVIPIYLIVRSLDWVDTFWALIIPNISGPLTIFLMRQFILSIPDELIEAARIDGVKEISIYTRIILPCSMPAIATLIIFQVKYHWNDYFWPLIMTNSTRMKTVQLGLSYFTGQVFTQWNLLMASVVTAVIPVIILFLLMQKHFVAGLTTTGIKG